MANWISKAANVFRRDANEAPQSFELDCLCGHHHSGLRRARHQHLVCKKCGLSLFVLPRDIYPAPLAPLRPLDGSNSSTLVSDDPDDDGDILGIDRKSGHQPNDDNFVDDIMDPLPQRDLPTPRQTRRKQMRKRQETREQPVPPQTPKKRPPREPADDGRPSLRDHAADAAARFLRFWTPFRAIAAGVLLVLAFTGLWSLNQGRLARAVTTAKSESDAGMESVRQKEWIAARDHFERAARAYDTLGRDDPESERIRQLFRETRALTRLCNVSLLDLVANAPVDCNEEQAEEWERTFHSRYAGTWLIIDGTIQRVKQDPEHPNESSYEMTIPWSTGTNGKRIRVRADFPVFDRLIGSDGSAAVLFAGELESCKLVADKEWVVRLKPESGFAWSNAQTWESLGLGNDPLHPEDFYESRLLKQSGKLEQTP